MMQYSTINLRCLATCVVFLLFASCGRYEQAIVGVENPDIPVDTVPGLIERDIFILTTRAPSSNDAIMFTGKRSSRLSFAKVTVTLPPNREPGTIERTKRLPPNPKKEMTIVKPVKYKNEAEFKRGINLELREPRREDRSGLLFVHGYNTNFSDAVIRLAQFAEDSGYQGIPVLFTWASAGKITDYVYDLNSALSARDNVLTAADILTESNMESMNVVAHSMGNFLTVEAMRQAQSEGDFDSDKKLRNIILASADIDIDVFRDQLSVFNPKERNFYVIISDDDKALRASRRIAGGVDRVGDADIAELESLGVTVIDLTEVQDPGSTNHSKFADSPEVVKIIGSQMLTGDSLNTGAKKPNVFSNAVSGVADAAQETLSGGG